jgi:hypothetical protein
LKVLRNVVGPILSVLALGTFVVFMFIVSRAGLRLIPEITSIHVVDGSHVSVAWKIKNTGSDPAYFKSCTIQLRDANGDAVGSWTGGPTMFTPLGGSSSNTSLVKVTHGSSDLVTAAQSKVSCSSIVNAHG